MSETVPLFLLHLLGFAGFLWLGLYTLTHGDAGRIATLTGITALATACFFVDGAALIALNGAPAASWVSRGLWWSNVIPVALWLHLSLRLNPGRTGASASAATDGAAQRASNGRRRALLTAVYGAALILIVVATPTGLVLDFRHQPSSAGPAYLVYAAYLLACTGFAALNLSRMRAPAIAVSAAPGATVPANGGVAAPDGARPTASGAGAQGVAVGLLVVGAVCFLLGAGYLALRTLFQFSRYEFPAYLLLLAGLAAVGATVAVQSGLLLGKDVRRDAAYSLTGLAILIAIYLVAAGAMLGFDRTREQMFAIVLVALITAGHTLYDAGRDWLDRVFFTPAVREERAAARAYAAALATQPAGPHPDLATRKAFDDAVRRAITNLSDPTKLATTPLLNLTAVSRAVAESHLEDNRLNRAAVLKEMLLDLIDGLRPHDGSGRVTGDAWRFYNCLYYPYVRGIGRRRAPGVLRQLAERRRREGTPRGDLEQALEWLLQVDEDTFYKWQRRGSDTIAAALREREAAAGGAVPAEDTSNLVPVGVAE